MHTRRRRLDSGKPRCGVSRLAHPVPIARSQEFSVSRRPDLEWGLKESPAWSHKRRLSTTG